MTRQTSVMAFSGPLLILAGLMLSPAFVGAGLAHLEYISNPVYSMRDVPADRFLEITEFAQNYRELDDARSHLAGGAVRC